MYEKSLKRGTLQGNIPILNILLIFVEKFCIFILKMNNSKKRQEKIISDLMNEMGFEKKIAKETTEHIKNHSISQNLTVLRAKTNLSQSEMAKKMNTSQSFISKLESASNDQIKIDDMCSYLATLGYETTITISKPQNIAQKIKGTYSQLVDLVKELQKCAVDDDCILEGIASFETEAAHNMLNLASMLIESSSAKLEKIHPTDEPKIVLDNISINLKEKDLVPV